MASHSKHDLQQDIVYSSDRLELAPSLTSAPLQQSKREGPTCEEMQGALKTVLRFVEQQDEACLGDEDDASIIRQLFWKAQAHSA